MNVWQSLLGSAAYNLPKDVLWGSGMIRSINAAKQR
jgi:hypothetical protein